MLEGLISNDFDPDGDSIYVQQATSPAHEASFSIWPDGHFTYTPETDFVGIDSFTYTITDGYGKYATATVTIEVGTPG